MVKVTKTKERYVGPAMMLYFNSLNISPFLLLLLNQQSNSTDERCSSISGKYTSQKLFTMQ